MGNTKPAIVAPVRAVGPAANAGNLSSGAASSLAAAANSVDADLAIARVACSLVVTLQRPADRDSDSPKVPNALTAAMRQALADALAAAADDPVFYGVVIRSGVAGTFCGGVDLAELSALMRRSPAESARAIARLYALIWRLECFGRPTVSLIDGAIGGTGVGLSAFGTHRVAAAGYRLALPGPAVGFFPDAGAAHVLARLPRHIGLYLGLTGRPIGRADAYRLGFVTHCIEAQRFPEIMAAVADADPIDPVLDDRHQPPGPAPLEAYGDVIERCFSADGVEAIIARLRAEPRQRDWCDEVAADLARNSPLALKVAHRHIRGARHLDLRQTLVVDHRITCRLLKRADIAAAHAQPIDNARAVKWQPSRLSDVTTAMLDGVFAAMPGDELVLTTYNEL